MSVKVDQGDLRRILRKIDGVEEALSARVTANVLTSAAREVRNEAIGRTKRELPGLASSKIRADIKLVRASPNRPRAMIDISRRPTNLVRFGARQVGAGVSVAFRSGRKVVGHAFIARGRSGNKLVFRRVGTKRLPIKALPGPSVGGVLHKHVEDLLKLASRDIRGEIAEKLRKVLGAAA